MVRPFPATYALLTALSALVLTGAAVCQARPMPDRHRPILADDTGRDEDVPRSGGSEDDPGPYGGDSEAAPILPPPGLAPDVIEPPGCPLDSAPLELIV